MEVRADSEPAKSQVLSLDIQSENGVIVSPTVTETPTETPTPSPTPTLTPQAGGEPPAKPAPKQPQLADWIMAILVASAIAWSTYRLAALIGQVRWGVRSGFLALIGGLLAYTYLALHMPGSEEFLRGSVARGVFLITLTGTGFGLLLAWIWRNVSTNSKGID
jgi:hypothetical protein